MTNNYTNIPIRIITTIRHSPGDVNIFLVCSFPEFNIGTPKLKQQPNVYRGFRASFSTMLNSGMKEYRKYPGFNLNY